MYEVIYPHRQRWTDQLRILISYWWSSNTSSKSSILGPVSAIMFVQVLQEQLATSSVATSRGVVYGVLENQTGQTSSGAEHQWTIGRSRVYSRKIGRWQCSRVETWSLFDADRAAVRMAVPSWFQAWSSERADFTSRRPTVDISLHIGARNHPAIVPLREQRDRSIRLERCFSTVRSLAPLLRLKRSQEGVVVEGQETCMGRTVVVGYERPSHYFLLTAHYPFFSSGDFRPFLLFFSRSWRPSASGVCSFFCP